jgi:hypothetical protein
MLKSNTPPSIENLENLPVPPPRRQLPPEDNISTNSATIGTALPEDISLIEQGGQQAVEKVSNENEGGISPIKQKNQQLREEVKNEENTNCSSNVYEDTGKNQQHNEEVNDKSVDHSGKTLCDNKSTDGATTNPSLSRNMSSVEPEGWQAPAPPVRSPSTKLTTPQKPPRRSQSTALTTLTISPEQSKGQLSNYIDSSCYKNGTQESSEPAFLLNSQGQADTTETSSAPSEISPVSTIQTVQQINLTGENSNQPQEPIYNEPWEFVNPHIANVLNTTRRNKQPEKVLSRKEQTEFISQDERDCAIHYVPRYKQFFNDSAISLPSDSLKQLNMSHSKIEMYGASSMDSLNKPVIRSALVNIQKVPSTDTQTEHLTYSSLADSGYQDRSAGLTQRHRSSSMYSIINPEYATIHTPPPEGNDNKLYSTPVRLPNERNNTVDTEWKSINAINSNSSPSNNMPPCKSPTKISTSIKRALQQRNFIIPVLITTALWLSASLIYWYKSSGIFKIFLDKNLFSYFLTAENITNYQNCLIICTAIIPLIVSLLLTGYLTYRAAQNIEECRIQKGHYNDLSSSYNDIIEDIFELHKERAIKSIVLEYSDNTMAKIDFSTWEKYSGGWVCVNKEFAHTAIKPKLLINNKSLFTSALALFIITDVFLPTNLGLYIINGNISLFHSYPNMPSTCSIILSGLVVVAVELLVLGTLYYSYNNEIGYCSAVHAADHKTISKPAEVNKLIKEAIMTSPDNTESILDVARKSSHKQADKIFSQELKQVTISSHGSTIQSIYNIDG